MKLVLDMNLSPKWNSVLRGAGHESVHWSTLGPGDTPDTDIATYAAENGFTVVTSDLDFGKILVDRNTSKPSVIQLRVEDARPNAVGHLVLSALDRYKDDLAEGAFITIEDRGTRLRTLPFRKVGEP
jgi:predicted nuclease of predicted toxin-antitoxin system